MKVHSKRNDICDIEDEDIPSEWWDPRKPDSFFGDLYREGDNSLEGHIPDNPMTIKERTIRECDMVEAIALTSKADKILDCPCGLGRHSIELAKRGYVVTGVDLDQKALLRAEETSSQYDIKGRIDFVEADIRDLPLPSATFQTVINMFLSFGFFESDKDNLRVLEEFARVLTPRGRLLIHSDVNPTRVTNGSYSDRSVRTLCNGGMLKISERINTETGRLEGAWLLFKDDRLIKKKTYSVVIYSHSEIANMLKLSGFDQVEALTVDGRKISENSLAQEVVYLAVKGL